MTMLVRLGIRIAGVTIDDRNKSIFRMKYLYRAYKINNFDKEMILR